MGNHLGIASLDARKLKHAEEHFRAAVDGGEQRIERDGAQVPWAILENRPYLRALGNLALALAEQRKWPEALAIHQRILKLNPDDNQGVRYLIGVEHLHVGDNQGAIKAFEKCLGEEVGCAFGLALARFGASGPSADIGEPLLRGFAENRYVAPCSSASAGSGSTPSTARTWPSRSGRTTWSRRRPTSGTPSRAAPSSSASGGPRPPSPCGGGSSTTTW
ncbi:MAG: tetratricopeptide repeat protein [Labilithrix sp.]|nr:tetratricopeptide repeat protein [Labilithrix sp.]MBX3213680.1 tetratricopeptide repeat protein [Labilithrix sp.]